MKDLLENDTLLRSYFDTERSKNISMPAGIEDRIMERLTNRSIDATYDLKFNKALIWSCAGVVVVAIVGLCIYFSYCGFVDFSAICDRVRSVEFPKVDLPSTPMSSLWLSIGVIATGLMICSLYLSRRLHSHQ